MLWTHLLCGDIVKTLLSGMADADSLPPPVACDLRAFDVAQRERYDELVGVLRAAVLERRELPDGYAFVLPSDPAICTRAMEFAMLERRCCPFWTLRLELAPQGGPLTLSLTGPEGAEELLAGFLEE